MEKEYDVFVSHHTESSRELVKALSELLSGYGVKDWYSERDIAPLQNYAVKIPEAIEKSRILLLLLNEFSNNSEQVLREYQHADRLQIPILIVKLDNCKIRTEFGFLNSSRQYVDASNVEGMEAVQIVAMAVKNALEKRSVMATDSQNLFFDPKANELEFYGDEGERERLKTQHGFLCEFARSYYEEFLADDGVLSFLDVGCNTGEQAFRFLERHPQVQYFGIDREVAALKRGKEMFPSACFYQGDCCDTDAFDALLSSIEKTNGLDGFDLINVSMLLLHLDNNETKTLMDILSKHLSDDGRIVILDIDDGFNVAYPDESGAFRKAIQICAETKYSGYRKSGRRFCSLLADVDIQNITLHRIGLSTVGMNRSQRGKFFEIYFWFILDDLIKMNKENPDNQVVKTHLDFMKSHYKQMEFDFKKKSFFFNLGFVLYSGKKGAS